jgi:hypothetical protein
MPSDWLAYTDPAGYEWRLADDGYWWLLNIKQWHRAYSQTASDVLGVSVPVVSVPVPYNDAWSATRTYSEAGMVSSFGIPSTYGGYIGSGGSNVIHHSGNSGGAGGSSSSHFAYGNSGTEASTTQHPS